MDTHPCSKHLFTSDTNDFQMEDSRTSTEAIEKTSRFTSDTNDFQMEAVEKSCQFTSDTNDFQMEDFLRKPLKNRHKRFSDGTLSTEAIEKSSQFTSNTNDFQMENFLWKPLKNLVSLQVTQMIFRWKTFYGSR